MKDQMNSTIEVFSTCPQSTDYSADGYLQRVRKVAQWSERPGCKGILVYSDNRLVDSWQVAQMIVESTQKLAPLIAVQPVYMHPYTVAKLVATIGFMNDRRIYLNMVAGRFKNDLEALNDSTPHDLRLIEYTTIIKELLKGDSPVTFEGDFYQVYELSLSPELPDWLFPGIFNSGSSKVGREAASKLGATPIKYPQPVGDYEVGQESGDGRSCIRIGIIARDQTEKAWETGLERCPPDREGQLAHKLAMKTSDSEWHKQLSELSKELSGKESPYWMYPFENYQTFCPYLVGSYERVSREIQKYICTGFETFILDIPPSKEELEHIGTVFKNAKERSTT